MALLLGWSHVGAIALASLLHLLVIVRAITRANRTPASRVAWVAVITFLPWLGLIAYLLLGETSIGRERVRRLREASEQLAGPAGVSDAADRLDAQARPLSDLIRSINGFAPVAGNRIRLLGDPGAPASEPKADCNAAISALVADIDQAGEHVHVCFYIWLDDGHGGRVADAVAAAVGSANMDRRSLQLNFENNLLIVDAKTTAAVRERQLGYLSVSREVGLDEVSQWSLGRRLVQNTVGMMGPVL